MPELKKPGDQVLPGDPLAMSEEYLPGEGAVEDGQYLRAARFGQFEVDPGEMRVVVKPMTSTPARVHEGDYVFGLIRVLKPQMSAVNVLHIEGTERIVTGDRDGTLHVSKVAKRYVSDLGREYRLGDIIRARVIQSHPSVQLSTEDSRCGAILCRCLTCRTPMDLRGQGLECGFCGRRDTRNLAPDYGEVYVSGYVAALASHA